MERVASVPIIDGTKKVFYGIGRAIESQSPRAWNERIINVINTKIIPKLTPEQLAWVAKHRGGIEGFARGAAVTIPALELTVAAMGVQYAARWLLLRRRYAQALRQRARVQESRRQFPTEWPFVPLPQDHPPTSVSRKVDSRLNGMWVDTPWRPHKKSLKSLKKVLDAVGIHVAIPTQRAPELSGFTKWAQALRREYMLKYENPAEAALLVGTLRIMLGRVGLFAESENDKVNLRFLVQDFASGKKFRQEHAYRRLKKSFISAFVEMQQNVGWHAVTPTQAMVQHARAGELFDRWSGINLLGFPDVAAVVEPDKHILERVRHDMRIPLVRDFNVAGRTRDFVDALKKPIVDWNPFPEDEQLNQEMLPATIGKPIKPAPLSPVTASNIDIKSSLGDGWTDRQIDKIQDDNERGHKMAKARRAQARLEYAKKVQEKREYEEGIRQKGMQEVQDRGRRLELITLVASRRIAPEVADVLLQAETLLHNKDDETVRNLVTRLGTPRTTMAEQVEQAKVAARLFSYILEKRPELQKQFGVGSAKDGAISAKAAEWVSNNLPGITYLV